MAPQRKAARANVGSTRNVLPHAPLVAAPFMKTCSGIAVTMHVLGLILGQDAVGAPAVPSYGKAHGQKERIGR